MPNAIVILDQRIVGHKVHNQLEFREPKWDDYVSVGDPYVWATSPEDPTMVRPVPLPDRIRDYAERLIAEGQMAGDAALLSQLGMKDTKRVEGAICGFFLAVDPRVTAGSTASQKPLSSTSNGDPMPLDGSLSDK